MRSFTVNDFLATSGPFHEPLIGPRVRSEPEQHPNPAPTRPRVRNYVTAGEELRDGQPLKPGELRDR